MSRPRRLYCLHGFLGLPEDWDAVLGSADVRAGLGGPSIEAVNLWRDPLGPRDGGPARWAATFNRSVEGATSSTSEQRILLGYSMGGRLALHALLDAPRLWAAAIIVSAHTGLERSDARRARLVNDEAWARRFESEPWDDLLAAWNAQAVFGGRATPSIREEAWFSRGRLAAALRQWSLGHQENLLPRLAQLQLPVLWMAGADDPKFVGVVSSVRRLGVSRQKVEVIQGAGHRVPWERTESFLSRVKAFLHETT